MEYKCIMWGIGHGQAGSILKPGQPLYGWTIDLDKILLHPMKITQDTDCQMITSGFKKNIFGQTITGKLLRGPFGALSVPL